MNNTNAPVGGENTNRPKRIAIYVIFDRDGILDGFRKYYLEKLREVTDRIVAVVNGTLTPESRQELAELTDDFFVRENKGLLAYGWIEGIKHIGWKTLGEYDELLMLNDSFFGPFYPLSELMDAAEKSDADFYGVMKNFEDEKITNMAGHGFKHGHLRGSICYFYIIKSRLLHSSEFKCYWSEGPNVENDWDTYFFSEFDFFDFVKDAGFKIDAYQDDALKGYAFDNLTHNMLRLTRDNKIPFARTRAFCTNLKDQNLQLNYGKDARETIEFIDKHTDYDVNMIWDYILRIKGLNDIWYQMQMEYVISSEQVEKTFSYDKRVAAIVHIYYKDLVEYIAGYCENFIPGTDFYVTTTTEDTKEAIEKAFSKRGLHFECVVRPNVGVAMSTLWVTYADVVTSGKYEYICYFHDKKSNYWDYSIEGEQFGLRCYENLMGSKEIVMNVLNLFINNPRLGILGPPDVYHGHYFNTAMTTWDRNYENVIKLAERMNIRADVKPGAAPIAPYGDMFWFRADALKKAVGYGFTYDDFDFKYSPDGTILHAIERLYGFFAQDSGFYFAEVISTDDARSDLVNYRYMLYKLCEILQQNGQCVYSYEAAKDIASYYLAVNKSEATQSSARLIVKTSLKNKIPQPIWRCMKKVYRFFGGKKWLYDYTG